MIAGDRCCCGWARNGWAGSWAGQARYVFLFDLAALAAFVWALVVTYQIWRQRRDD